MLARQKEKLKVEPTTEPSSPTRSDIMDDGTNMPSSPEMWTPSRLMVRREDTPDPDDWISPDMYETVSEYIKAKEESSSNKYLEDYYSLEVRTNLLVESKEMDLQVANVRRKLDQVRNKKLLSRIKKWKVVQADLKKVEEIKKRIEVKKQQEIDELRRREEQKKIQQQQQQQQLEQQHLLLQQQQRALQQQNQNQQNQHMMMIAQLLQQDPALMQAVQSQQLAQQQQAARVQAQAQAARDQAALMFLLQEQQQRAQQRQQQMQLLSMFGGLGESQIAQLVAASQAQTQANVASQSQQQQQLLQNKPK